MGLLKWIRENNVNNTSTNNHKRRQSEPIQIITNNTYYKYNKIHKKSNRDDDYIEALLKFNDWRTKNGTNNNEINHNNINNNFNYKTTKYSLKQKKHLNDSLVYESPHKNSIKTFLNNKFNKIERFSLPPFRLNDNNRTSNSTSNELERNKNLAQYDEVNDTIYNDINKNTTIENINTSCSESPPIKFYRKSINPFLDYKSPKSCKNKISLYDDNKNNNSDNEDDEERIDYQHSENMHINEYIPQKHMYQTVINKHGEPVEYALPMLVNKLSKQSKSPDLDIKNSYCTAKFNEPIDLVGEDTEMRREVIITDLDKSDGEIYQKVQGDAHLVNNSLLFEYPDIHFYNGNFSKNLDYINKYKPNDIQIFPYETINTSSSKLEFGKIYNTKIMKLNYGNINKYFKENGSKRNCKLLSYFRHPNISLLMGIMCSENNQINSLYVESFSCSLHALIHKKDKCLKIKDIIDFTQQIINSVLYIHENNIVHSNICSHNILVSETEKIVKLSSFELATITTPPEGLNINDITSENQLSFEYLPYYINYRKEFSIHIYQPPELISTVQEFVYPVKQSDIYGICLIIWEMLNQSVPFALFSYSDLNKIFNTQSARLPLFDENRNKLFKTTLENGLIINVDERIKDIYILTEYFNDIKVQYLKETDLKEFEIPRNFDSEQNRPRTSTLKRNSQKQIEPNYMNGSINQMNEYELHQSYENNSNVKNLQIAENAKQLKENWLSGNQIADIKIIKRTPNNIGSKIYNLNIKITPKNESNSFPAITNNDELIQSPNLSQKEITFNNFLNNIKIDTKNINITPEEISANDIANKTGIIECENDNKHENQSSKSVSQQINFWNSIKVSPENIVKVKNQNKKDSINDPELKEEILNKTYPNMPEILNEILHKNTSNKSFEKSQWKQESKICEAKLKQNEIDVEKQISVKDAINKFEIISNSPGNQSSITYKKLDNTLNYNIDSNKNDSIFETSLNVVLKSPRNDSIAKKDKGITENLIEDHQYITKASLNLSQLNIFPMTTHDRHSICNPEIFKNLTSNIFNKAENLFLTPNSTILRRINSSGIQNLKCWNCGIKIFNINNELNRTSSRISNYQNSKSIEDLYIDDDFIQNIELGANMELHSEIFDTYL